MVIRNSTSKGEAGLRLPGITVWMEITLQAEEMCKDGHKERVCWAVGRQGSQWGPNRGRVWCRRAGGEAGQGPRVPESQGVENTHGNKSSGKTWRGDTGATESDSLVKDHSKRSHRTRSPARSALKWSRDLTVEATGWRHVMGSEKSSRETRITGLDMGNERSDGKND